MAAILWLMPFICAAVICDAGIHGRSIRSKKLGWLASFVVRTGWFHGNDWFQENDNGALRVWDFRSDNACTGPSSKHPLGTLFAPTLNGRLSGRFQQTAFDLAVPHNR